MGEVDMTPNENKLYVVTRRDLSPGYQIVQSCHAVESFARAFPWEVDFHLKVGDTMVCLAARNESDLFELFVIMKATGASTIAFWEPDINEYTAFAVAPSDYHYMLGHLPLAGSDLKRKRWWNR